MATLAAAAAAKGGGGGGWGNTINSMISNTGLAASSMLGSLSAYEMAQASKDMAKWTEAEVDEEQDKNRWLYPMIIDSGYQQGLMGSYANTSTQNRGSAWNYLRETNAAYQTAFAQNMADLARQDRVAASANDYMANAWRLKRGDEFRRQEQMDRTRLRDNQQNADAGLRFQTLADSTRLRDNQDRREYAKWNRARDSDDEYRGKVFDANDQFRRTSFESDDAFRKSRAEADHALREEQFRADDAYRRSRSEQAFSLDDRKLALDERRASRDVLWEDRLYDALTGHDPSDAVSTASKEQALHDREQMGPGPTPSAKRVTYTGDAPNRTRANFSVRNAHPLLQNALAVSMNGRTGNGRVTREVSSKELGDYHKKTLDYLNRTGKTYAASQGAELAQRKTRELSS